MYFLLTTRCSAPPDAQGDIPQGETSTSASSSPPTHASLPQLHLPCHQASPISTVVSTTEGQILGKGLPPPTPQRPANPHHSCVTSRYITIPIVSSLSFLAPGAHGIQPPDCALPFLARPLFPAAIDRISTLISSVTTPRVGVLSLAVAPSGDTLPPGDGSVAA